VAVLESDSGAIVAASGELDSQRADALLWSPDGTVLFQGGFEEHLRRLDPETLELVGEDLSLAGPISDIVALPGGEEFAVATRVGDVHFVDASTGRSTRDPIRSGGTDLEGLAVSPDGERLAAISTDGALRLWRLSDGRAIGPPLRGHGNPALGIAWPTAERLITSGYSLTQWGNLISWEVSPDGWVERACAIAGRDLTQDEWQRYLPGEEYRRTCA
jgi:WD40 repeat protein